MGMFDNVICEIKCPVCRNKVNDFQTKDGPRLMMNISINNIQRWYTSCFKCGLSIEFKKPNKGDCFTCDKRFKDCKQSEYGVTYGCERYQEKGEIRKW